MADDQDSGDFYEQLREEIMGRWRSQQPPPDADAERRRQEHEETQRAAEAFRMWRTERKERWYLEEHPHAAKDALDSMRETTKQIELLLRMDRLSPEAVGFTSRKVANLIKLLEQLKAKLDESTKKAQP